jgi:hypothetical protein
MAVYVDPVRGYGGSERFRWPRSCRLYADTLEELHAMAVAIGLKRAWFQNHAELPHYDLAPAKRARAVELGAVEHDAHQMIEFKRRRAGVMGSGNLFGEG